MGHPVVLIDSRRIPEAKEPLAGILPATVLRADIRDTSVIEQTLAGCRIVFHLAARKEVVSDEGLARDTISTNVMGTESVLIAAKRAGAKLLVFTSSVAVYGEHKGPVKETTKCRPISEYGRSKLEAEQLCSDYQTPSFRTVVLRLSNVYG
jgi:nucleoside-diphosphate-sugar epimerase